MLGWEALESTPRPLFDFAGLDAEARRTQLLNAMPEELFSLAAAASIPIDTLRPMVTPRPAAPFSARDEIVLHLAREKESEILSPEGQGRSRTLKRIRPTDRIAVPRQS